MNGSRWSGSLTHLSVTAHTLRSVICSMDGSARRLMYRKLVAGLFKTDGKESQPLSDGKK